MGFSSGTFTRTDGTRTGSDVWTQAKNAAVKIVSSGHDTHDQDIANGLSTCILKDGTQTITADIPWNSKKITSLAAGVSRTDAANLSNIQDFQTHYGGVTTGASGTFVATLSPVITGYVEGMIIEFRAHQAPSGSGDTLNVNSVGAIAIKKYGGSTNLTAFDFVAGSTVLVAYSTATSAHFEFLGCPQANAVDDTMIRLRNAQYLRARNAANSADLNVLGTDASDNVYLSAPGAKSLNFSTNGTQRYLITSGGNFNPQLDNTYQQGDTGAEYSYVYARNHICYAGAAVYGTLQSNQCQFKINNTIRWYMDTTGDLLPNLTSTYNMGSSSLIIANVWSFNFIGSGGTTRFGTTSAHQVDIKTNNTIRVSILSGDAWVQLTNASTDPSTPTGAGILYCKLGALYYKGSSGTVTNLAPA